MELEKLKNKVKKFDKNAGFDRTDFKKLVKMIEEEVSILKSNPENRNIINHELTDLLILIMQIGYRYNIDFDLELEKWFKKSKKYNKKYIHPVPEEHVGPIILPQVSSTYPVFSAAFLRIPWQSSWPWPFSEIFFVLD
jgi:uncharacterized protein YabN with tetrapyrrole methylase and pyrophosphatase domain